MKYDRIKELMKTADNERLSYSEIIEIQEAYDKVPDSFLRDFRDNASTVDMLLDLEAYHSAVKTSDGRVVKVELT